jgi:hypothetical protein
VSLGIEMQFALELALCAQRNISKEMQKSRRFIIGGLIVLAALSHIIYGGMHEAIVYFVTPSS